MTVVSSYISPFPNLFNSDGDTIQTPHPFKLVYKIIFFLFSWTGILGSGRPGLLHACPAHKIWVLSVRSWPLPNKKLNNRCYQAKHHSLLLSFSKYFGIAICHFYLQPLVPSLPQNNEYDCIIFHFHNLQTSYSLLLKCGSGLLSFKKDKTKWNHIYRAYNNKL